jgi:hypothetical protein
VELEGALCQTGATSADEIAVLRIELEDTEPVIWRRVAVRATTSLARLHRIVQAAMGWLDYHLWEFAVDDTVYGVPGSSGAARSGRQAPPSSRQS